MLAQSLLMDFGNTMWTRERETQTDTETERETETKTDKDILIKILPL